MAGIAHRMEHFVDYAERDKFLTAGRDFVDEPLIEDMLESGKSLDPQHVRDIAAKSLDLQRLEPEETAALLQVDSPALWEELFDVALKVKQKVYGTRIVTFAPLYLSNKCINSCKYCAFRCENRSQRRRALTLEEAARETKQLVSVGHKRLIMVYGEHPETGADYIGDTIKAVYAVREGRGEIRRVNINAAPMCVDDLRRLHDIGIGTFQVFQETYHHKTYRKVHPRGPKADYTWRLYALHRAQEAGIDDVGIGALFGLYDWRFEVMGLLFHTIDLEKRFGGVGPHTISFPRLEPALGSPLSTGSSYMVSDQDFRRLIAIIRLSVPYTGMIITAREPAAIRRAAIRTGCTQTDASTRIGIGAYSEKQPGQHPERQQFRLGDTRDLDSVICELAQMGHITSFCTAGYRCGRTGDYFMNIAKTGKVHHFCMPNAILTFMEYLLDYGSPGTVDEGLKLIEDRMVEIPEQIRPALRQKLSALRSGERDLLF